MPGRCWRFSTPVPTAGNLQVYLKQCLPYYTGVGVQSSESLERSAKKPAHTTAYCATIPLSAAHRCGDTQISQPHNDLLPCLGRSVAVPPPNHPDLGHRIQTATRPPPPLRWSDLPHHRHPARCIPLNITPLLHSISCSNNRYTFHDRSPNPLHRASPQDAGAPHRRKSPHQTTQRSHTTVSCATLSDKSHTICLERPN